MTGPIAQVLASAADSIEHLHTGLPAVTALRLAANSTGNNPIFEQVLAVFASSLGYRPDQEPRLVIAAWSVSATPAERVLGLRTAAAAQPAPEGIFDGCS